MAAVAVGAVLELEVTALAAGGDGIARQDDGRVVFVEGALPGERVRAEVVEAKKDFARLQTIAIVSASPDRVEPPCPQVALGCGGCDLLHAAGEAQGRLKRSIVVDALRRLGGVIDAEELVVEAVRRVPDAGYRTTVRAVVDEHGRAGLRRRRSHDPVAFDRCLVAHPLVEEVLVEGRFGSAREVTVRVGVSSQERLVIIGPRIPKHGVSVPEGVRIVPGHALARPIQGRNEPAIHEDIGGRTWRVSARSFFQSGPAAAQLLVDVVSAAVAPVLDEAGAGAALVDAYAGVGLLGGAIVGPRPDVRLIAIESHPSAVSDARRNLGGIDCDVVSSPVADIEMAGGAASAPDVVIADPSRTGLGADGAAALAALNAELFVLVSCDPASFGRDTRVLASMGYRLVAAHVLDLFPGTSHVETVATFVRGRAR